MWFLPVKTYKHMMEVATNINQLFQRNTFLHSFGKYIYFREQRRCACEHLKLRADRTFGEEPRRARGTFAGVPREVLELKEQRHRPQKLEV